MTRLRPLPPDCLTPAQLEEYERMTRMRKPLPDGSLGGPFDAWLRSPELARMGIRMGNFVSERTVLGKRLVRLALTLTAADYQSKAAWLQARSAFEHGTSELAHGDIADGRTPADAPEDEQLIYDLCRCLHERQRIPEQLYQRALAAFGEQGIVELVGTLAYHSFVVMTCNAFEIE